MSRIEAGAIHATCVLVGEAGLLIEGAPGSGKSALARDILAAARLQGRFARLVGDDRVRVEARHGRLLASAIAPIAGLIEIRGLGILGIDHEPAACVRLLITLSSQEPPRFPDERDAAASLCGIMVPRVFLKTGAASAPLALAALDGALGRIVTP